MEEDAERENCPHCQGSSALRNASVKIVFEEYVLDPDRRELTRGSEAIAVGPQVFDVLVYLVRNRERVVTKDNLIDAVWCGRIVSESTLTSHINAVRKAIGDCGAQQRLVRTIARKGYRFVGEVRQADTSKRADPAAPAKPRAQALVLPDRPSIAVLPYLNPSDDPIQDHLVDGVMKDIIASLSRMSCLFVIAQGLGDRPEAGRPGAEGALRPRRQLAQSGEPRSDHGAAHRRSGSKERSTTPSSSKIR